MAVKTKQQAKAPSVPQLPKNQGGPIELPPELRKAFADNLDKQITKDLTEQLANAQKQLADTIEKLDRQKSELHDLRIDRAKLSLDGKATSTADKYIDEVAAEVANAPVAIELLHQQIESLKAQLDRFKRDRETAAQKERVTQLQTLSGKLVEQLEASLATNCKLRSVWDEYDGASLNLEPHHVTLGSLGLLKAMVETFKGEVEHNIPRGPIGGLHSVLL